jgi:hypothetical protein
MAKPGPKKPPSLTVKVSIPPRRRSAKIEATLASRAVVRATVSAAQVTVSQTRVGYYADKALVFPRNVEEIERVRELLEAVKAEIVAQDAFLADEKAAIQTTEEA